MVPRRSDPRRRPQAESGPLNVVYEDPWILAVNKPPGTVVHPTYKNTSGTLLNAVLWRVRNRAGAQPGILTRLDKGTSGLVLVALTPQIHATLQRDVAAGLTRKEYLAVVRGTPTPPQGSIVLPLARDPNDRRRMIVTPGGAHSETRYEALSPAIFSRNGGSSDRPDVSLLRCELVTGRTHQIRVHLASCGWPILGDFVYGEPHQMIGRQALHAWRMSFPHPVSRAPLQLSVRVPADMTFLIHNA